VQSYGHSAAPRPTCAPVLVCWVAGCLSPILEPPQPHQETIMGKYLLAWLLGVPGIVLLLVYLFFN
jgi:hypothetical protein